MSKASFYTTDFALAAALETEGFPVDAVEPDEEDNRRMVFYFIGDAAALRSLSESYYARKMTVDPHRFYQNIKNLKTRLHDAKNSMI